MKLNKDLSERPASELRGIQLFELPCDFLCPADVLQRQRGSESRLELSLAPFPTP